MTRLFENTYLDKLMIGDKGLLNLRTDGVNLGRNQLAKRLGISAHSIRRYETENRAPDWYYQLLRLNAGDLSYFGARWSNCRIQPQTSKLSTPYDTNAAYYPVDLNLKYSHIFALSAAKFADAQELAKQAIDVINGLENENLQLQIRLSRYEKTTRPGGNVVHLFG